ncbi:protein cornichon homolog 4 isoform X2 [Physcomitrium patens]|uniref:protein cornichon homolog 4 isoform X2 n=1 Tax=Physcomitrium patens TaxID=3218 RepID=UPI000D17CC30|nr:protein cornichon homolog 4-like isoform X2 [Physcomitrium patens]|eukprot:XP_024379778.1 protein cornichon homolog 4-like isoform X2 [Physcomitrella patens]
MASDLLLWLICFLAVVSLLGILVYQLMCLSDLEFDYINPFDSASRINAFIVPEFLIHGALGCICLLSGHWLLFLLNVPLAYYHINLYLKKEHLLDVTEIFNLLDREKKYRLAKLAFYLLLFFIVIYKILIAIIVL